VCVINTIGESELEVLKGRKVEPIKEVPYHPRARVGAHDELGQAIGVEGTMRKIRDERSGVVVARHDIETHETRASREYVPDVLDGARDGRYHQMRDMVPSQVE
jgi:hypothetical protein